MPRAGQRKIRFRGPPSKLAADVSLQRRDVRAATIRVADRELPLIASGDAEKISSLSFALPPDTPPGEMTASVEIGGSSLEAVVDVEARPLVRFEPALLEFEARPGASVATTVDVTNLGNGAAEREAGNQVTLREPGALGRGVGAAFRDRGRDFAGKLIALGRQLADEPAHELKLIRCEPPGPLASGEHRRLELEFAAPADLPADSRLSGSLAIFGSRLRLAVETRRDA